MKALTICLSLFGVCLVGPSARAQTEALPHAVYFAAYRTPAHVRYSKPDVFHEVVAGVIKYLESRHVAIVQDPVRKRIETADLIPIPTLVNIARDAGASSLLLLTVDRPKTKWVKVIAEAYDLSGNLLWKEAVDEGGGLSGKGGVAKALAKLQKRLEPRLGRPGLEQVRPADEKQSSSPAKP